MTDDDIGTIAELEQRHERLKRKAKRRPSWQRACDSVEDELLEAKRERVEELEARTDDDEISTAGAILARRLGETDVGRTDELQDEIDQHRSDIAELESQ